MTCITSMSSLFRILLHCYQLFHYMLTFMSSRFVYLLNEISQAKLFAQQQRANKSKSHRRFHIIYKPSRWMLTYSANPDYRHYPPFLLLPQHPVHYLCYSLVIVQRHFLFLFRFFFCSLRIHQRKAPTLALH